MLGMSGLDLLRHLNQRALQFLTIVVTGHGDIPLAVRAMKEGAVDFIEKPYAIEAVLDGIETAITRLAEPRPNDPGTIPRPRALPRGLRS